jgi:hypothetical protein
MEFLREALEGVRLLNWIQIFALKIFNQRHLQGHLIGHVSNHYRNATEACSLRGSPSAFACDELVTRTDPADYKWLDDAACLNGPRQLFERLHAKTGAGLKGAGLDEVDIDLQETVS